MEAPSLLKHRNSSSSSIEKEFTTGSNSNSSSIDEDDFSQQDKIIESLTLKYTEFGGDGEDLLTNTVEYIRDNIKSNICLICIEDVNRCDPIWSCQKCFCSLHLVCIQRWARDSIQNLKEKAAERGFNIPIEFCCPKCRNTYQESEFPDKYRCYCGKVPNPKPDPWIAPHSCGESCDKPLKPECGHSCLLLCHSGPCPPCPKQVTSTCFCGQSSPKTLRCYMKTWSCQKPCSKPLQCTIHKCPELCHSGDCSACKVLTSVQCKCSAPTWIEVECWKLLDPEYTVSCDNPCNKTLNCGIHKCQKTCHEDTCDACEKVCPCGKSRAPCTGDNVTGKPCEDTCDKPLDCQVHFCSQKCHLGSCGSCLQVVVKKCKCGLHEKEVLCSKEFTCTTKCRKLRDCQIHPCNKKCCPGDCPPCRNPCGKTLSCKNHKCESICHSGPCYPCPVTAQAKCRCGKTVRNVPCGSEKKCKTPECNLPCTRSSKCDHPAIQRHRCHFGDCPKCRLRCGKTLSCGHICPAYCHSSKLKTEQSTPCPKCVQVVNSKCSLHTNSQVRCHAINERCREICGKLLNCKEHYCLKPCHEYISSSCGDCNESCSKARPAECSHNCELGCHTGPCQPCTLTATLTCHCGTEEMYVQCFRQSRLTEHEKSCKNQCPRKLSCGHRCLSLCHSGLCPELERCRRKVKVSCKCKHLKKDLECFLLGESKTLDCQPGICNLPKASKETPSGGAKKRTRKKKTNTEPETEVADECKEKSRTEEFSPGTENSTQNVFTSNFKAVCVIAISAFITATILKYYGDQIIPKEYRSYL